LAAKYYFRPRNAKCEQICAKFPKIKPLPLDDFWWLGKSAKTHFVNGAIFDQFMLKSNLNQIQTSPL
jgi:ABC-type sulfate transport system substrate-binding protein